MSKQLTTRVGAAVAAGAFVAVCFAGSAGAASAGPNKSTPEPVQDAPGCWGRLNANTNHESGLVNGKDSKGPGYYFRDGSLFQEIRGEYWPSVCGPGAGVG